MLSKVEIAAENERGLDAHQAGSECSLPGFFCGMAF